MTFFEKDRRVMLRSINKGTTESRSKQSSVKQRLPGFADENA